METGFVVVEKVGGKSAVTRCFSKYPLKLIVPRKAGSSDVDAVWIYSLSYGGGIVSGDHISCRISVGDGCTIALTTQASTKVYKASGSECSEQVLEARIGRNALLAFIPDPVTCFSTARYSQKQIFRVFPDSNLVIVDWITSGRHESGEKWDFDLYKSINQILLEGDCPLFLDSVLLEPRSSTSIAERMQDYNVIAMVVIIGPRLKQIQDQVQEEVKKMMSDYFRNASPTAGRRYTRSQCGNGPTRPPLVASCSSFGSKADKCTIIDEAVTYIKSLQQTLQELHKQKLERIREKQTPTFVGMVQAQGSNSREAFLVEEGKNWSTSSSSMALANPLFPPCFKTWLSPNVVLNVMGEDAYINICSVKKPGLISNIFYVMDKHKLEVVSAQVSSDYFRSMYMIHVRAIGVSNQFPEALMIEKLYKLAAEELLLWLSW